MASRIEASLEAGEYRVLVKAHKRQMRGAFVLIATCSGPGCEGTVVECNPEEFASAPRTTGFTASCASRISEVYQGTTEFENETEIELPQRCQLRPLERLAVEYYYEWWDAMIGWEENFVYDDEEPVLTVRTVYLDGYQTGGTLITVDIYDADESSITFVFDRNSTLLMQHLDASYPEVEWYCGEPGETALDEDDTPDGECMGEYLGTMPHNADNEGEGSATVTMQNAADDIGAIPIAALSTYLADRELGEDVEVGLSWVTWESEHLDNGGRVTVVADSHPDIEYEVGDSGWGARVFTATDMATGETRFVCIEQE